MYEEESSQFESNIFNFKRKKANLIASYILVGGLGFGFLLGIVLYFFFYGGGLFSWFRLIAFCVVLCGLAGLAAGFLVGTLIDKKK